VDGASLSGKGSSAWKSSPGAEHEESLVAFISKRQEGGADMDNDLGLCFSHCCSWGDLWWASSLAKCGPSHRNPEWLSCGSCTPETVVAVKVIIVIIFIFIFLRLNSHSPVKI